MLNYCILFYKIYFLFFRHSPLHPQEEDWTRGDQPTDPGHSLLRKMMANPDFLATIQTLVTLYWEIWWPLTRLFTLYWLLGHYPDPGHSLLRKMMANPDFLATIQTLVTLYWKAWRPLSRPWPLFTEIHDGPSLDPGHSLLRNMMATLWTGHSLLPSWPLSRPWPLSTEKDDGPPWLIGHYPDPGHSLLRKMMAPWLLGHYPDPGYSLLRNMMANPDFWVPIQALATFQNLASYQN